MGSGKKGLYSGAYTGGVYPGSANYMKADDPFRKFIQKRKDVDANGYYDIIAHGTPNSITIEHNGISIEINHRTAARLFQAKKDYKGGAIRLLSCNTGKVSAGFAQNLANKLNRPVKAPTDYLWVRPNGTYFVAGAKKVNGILIPDYSKPGRFKTYHPGRRK